jgi:hypothetical protein
MTTEQARDAARIERGRIAAGDLSPGKREAIKVETSLAEYVAYLERKAASKGQAAAMGGQRWVACAETFRDVSLPQRDPCSAVDYNSEMAAQTSMKFREFPT